MSLTLFVLAIVFVIRPFNTFVFDVAIMYVKKLERNILILNKFLSDLLWIIVLVQKGLFHLKKILFQCFQLHTLCVSSLVSA